MSEPRLIILEGPDCCGKTTLAKQLINKFVESIYLHSTYHKDFDNAGLMLRYGEEMIRQAKLNIELGNTVILDRCWLSDHVYGSVLRGKALTQDAMFAFTKLVAELNPFFVFCISDLGYALHEKEKDEAHPYTTEQYHALQSEYRSMWLAFSNKDNTHLWDIETKPKLYHILDKLYKD